MIVTPNAQERFTEQFQFVRQSDEQSKDCCERNIGQWLKEDLREIFSDLLLSKNIKSNGMFDQKEVAKS